MELIYLWLNHCNGITGGYVLNPAYEEEINEINLNQTIKIVIREKKEHLNIFNNYLNVITFVGRNGSGKSRLVSVLNKLLHSINPVHSVLGKSDNYDDTFLNGDFCLITKENNSYTAYCSDVGKFNLQIKTNVIGLYTATFSDNVFDLDKKFPFEMRKLEQAKNSRIPSAMFQPFLKKGEDYYIDFTQRNDIYGIVNIKLKNYFYYDRFRLYDTVRSLIELYKYNETLDEKNKLKIFENKNHYLIFDKYSPYLDIYDALQWTNQRIQYAKKETYPITQLISRSTSAFSGKINSMKTSYDTVEKVIENLLPKMFFAYAVGEIIEKIDKPGGGLIKPDYEKSIKCLNSLDFPNSEERKQFYSELLGQNIPGRMRSMLQAYYEFEGDELGNSKLKDILKDKYEIVFDKKNKRRPILQLKSQFMANFNLKKKFPSYITEIERLKGISKNLYKKSNNEIYDFMSLSTGEQRLLRFMADLYITLNYKDLYRHAKEDINVYIFDEMDLSWHPEWQRKMVYYIEDMFKKTYLKNRHRKFNIIFTTHSPFILSDMPKENVVVLGSDNNMFNFKSFGANIQDIFNNGLFFDCDDCHTIGEFAKNVISEIGKIVSSNDLKADEIELLEKKIKIIDEPIIKNNLLELLYSNENYQMKNIFNEDFLRAENMYLKRKLLDYKQQLEQLKNHEKD